jgi:hypothetical protein
MSSFEQRIKAASDPGEFDPLNAPGNLRLWSCR